MKEKRLLILIILAVAGVWGYVMGSYDVYDKVAMLEGYVDKDYLQVVQATMISGGQWLEMAQKEKSMYLFGFGDGSLNTTAYFVPMDERKRESENRLPSFYSDLPQKEIAKKIDEFYAQKENLSVPVAHALLVVKNQQLGILDEDINLITEGYRQELKKIINH